MSETVTNMLNQVPDVPDRFYGVTEREACNDTYDFVIQQVRRLGYAILDAGYTSEHLNQISRSFDSIRKTYIANFGESALKEIDEYHTMRALLTYESNSFLQLAMNQHVLAVVRKLISGKFVLNQQNGVINPPGESYNQAAWHRDLPYQHYISSTPLAINALFCMDDFTCENGATFIIPASHKFTACPSEDYVRQNAIQLIAKAGQFIILDCMTFHSGGFNKTSMERRAVNQVYTIPYFKQQINLPQNIANASNLSDETREFLGFSYQEPVSVKQYLLSRGLNREKSSMS